MQIRCSNGHLLNILPFRHLSPDGKKMLPREMEMPAQVKRSSGVSANFLCDNSSYILAADNKNKQARTNECFNAAKALHSEILSDTDSNAAKAIINFFLSWQPENLDNLSFDAISKDDLISGSNITFLFEGIPVSEYSEIRSAWQRYYDNEKEGTKKCSFFLSILELSFQQITNFFNKDFRLKVFIKVFITKYLFKISFR